MKTENRDTWRCDHKPKNTGSQRHLKEVRVGFSLESLERGWPGAMLLCSQTECWRIDAFKLWCWRRLLRVPWTARKSNRSITMYVCNFIPQTNVSGSLWLGIWSELSSPPQLHLESSLRQARFTSSLTRTSSFGVWGPSFIWEFLLYFLILLFSLPTFHYIHGPMKPRLWMTRNKQFQH